MTLYSVNFFDRASVYSRPLGRRLVQRHRAKRIVVWLRRNGIDAYIAPARVNA